MSPRKIQRQKALKRTVKFLASCLNPKLCQTVIRASPDSVIKCICNAALNASQGKVKIQGKTKKFFAKHRKAFEKLIDPRLSIPKKRVVLNQKGGFAIIPLLLSTVLGSLGSSIFGNLFGSSQSQSNA